MGTVSMRCLTFCKLIADKINLFAHIAYIAYFTYLHWCTMRRSGRRGGLTVRVLDSGTSRPGSGPGRGHCVVFLGKTLLPRCLSSPRCVNGYRRNAGGNPAMD